MICFTSDFTRTTRSEWAGRVWTQLMHCAQHRFEWCTAGGSSKIKRKNKIKHVNVQSLRSQGQLGRSSKNKLLDLDYSQFTKDGKQLKINHLLGWKQNHVSGKREILRKIRYQNTRLLIEVGLILSTSKICLVFWLRSKVPWIFHWVI